MSQKVVFRRPQLRGHIGLLGRIWIFSDLLICSEIVSTTQLWCMCGDYIVWCFHSV